MNELKIPANLETISLNEQTNYRLIEIAKLKIILTKKQKIKKF